MGNRKGYTPSEESKKKVSDALKRAYAEGRHRGNGFETADSEEWRRKISEGLKKSYADGTKTLTGAALVNHLAPKKSEAERKARKLETQRVWRANNPEKVAQYKQEQNASRYGLTREEYEAPQLCDICKRPQQGRCKLAQDHDHSCCPEKTACKKCRRGRLCTNCNTLLGSAHDSVEILAAAISYLNFFKKEKETSSV